MESTGHTDSAGPPPRLTARILGPSRRHPLRLGAVVVAAVLVVLAAIAAWQLLEAGRRLQKLPDLVERAKTELESGDLAAAQSQLVTAASVLHSARATLFGSPAVDVLDVVPVAHQNIEAARSSVDLALRLVRGSQEVLRAAQPLQGASGRLEIPIKSGRVPVAAVVNVERQLDALLASLPSSPTPPPQSLVLGPLKREESSLYREVALRKEQLQRVADAITVLDSIAGAHGPTRYLIAVANTAEMRGAGGMILSYGVLEGSDGQLSLVRFGKISQLALSSPETSVKFPQDFMSTYSALDPTGDWHNVNMLSDFKLDAPVMAAMYQKATGQTVQGVIQIDPEGLASVLAATGPVQTPQLGQLSSSNVVAVTLNQAYFDYPNRGIRQDYSGQAAKAVFDKLASGEFGSLRSLGKALSQAGSGRHILAWSADPRVELALDDLGFSGGLPPSSVPFTQLTIQNFSGNKLDYYIHSSLVLSDRGPLSQAGVMDAAVSVVNDCPQGAKGPLEVFGPYPGSGLSAGEYVGLVTLYLPAGSRLSSVGLAQGVHSAPSFGSQGGIPVVTWTVDLEPGQSSSVHLKLEVPPLGSPPLFIPSPRVIPTSYQADFS